MPVQIFDEDAAKKRIAERKGEPVPQPNVQAIQAEIEKVEQQGQA